MERKIKESEAEVRVMSGFLKNPSELYLGRVIGVGATGNGKPFAVYAVSGRSEGSRERKLVIKEDSVWTDCLGEPTPEQLKKKDIYFYPAIKTGRKRMWSNKRIGNYAIVSNGIQTETIEECLQETSPKESVKYALRSHGHEGLVGDRYNTPRIAGISLPDKRSYNHDVIGIVTEDSLFSLFSERREGELEFLPTYVGGFNESIDNYDVKLPLWFDRGDMIVKVDSTDADGLAEEFYEWMNQDLVVSAAAAVFDQKNKGWDLAVKNLHGD